LHLKKEHDFSKAERGKFFQSDAVFEFPVYLDPDIEAYLSQLAEEKKIDVQQLVNEWLRANIVLVKSVH
jgi:hypothetical protein